MASKWAQGVKEYNMRKLTKQTIKPVLKFVSGWDGCIYSMNTKGAKYYGFTLDTYNGKNSWQGGFDWWLEDALKYEAYAINLETGIVYDSNKNIIMQTKEV